MALVLAGLVTVPVGALVAIPAIRLSGLYLALATFGFGLLVERMVFGTGLMFGGRGSRSAPRPGELFGLDPRLRQRLLLRVRWRWCSRSPVGHVLAEPVPPRPAVPGLADSPVALATHGTNVRVTRVLVFCISAFIAGIAGALFAAQAGSITGIGFGPFASLTWLTVLALAGPGRVLGRA